MRPDADVKLWLMLRREERKIALEMGFFLGGGGVALIYEAKPGL